MKQGFKKAIHGIAISIGGAFVTFATVPAVQKAVLSAVTGYPKVSGFLVSAAAVGLAYMQSRKSQ